MTQTIPRWKNVNASSDRVVIWGAADQCRVIAPILQSIGVSIEALVDDTPGISSPFDQIPLYSGERGLDDFLADGRSDGLGFVVAIGNPYGNVRVSLDSLMCRKELIPVSFSDPSALICNSLIYSEGLQVLPGAIINNDVVIGRQCIVNTRALVEHDCILNDGVEIGPGAVLCGRVTVGRNSWVGANATIRPRVHIGENSIVGAGAVVVSDIPSNVVVAGVPAKIIREMSA